MQVAVTPQVLGVGDSLGHDGEGRRRCGLGSILRPMESTEREWPQSGAELFVDSEPDWQMNACLQFMPPNWTAYVEGYRQAGALVVARVAAARGEQDFLVYPIVFLYRQYIELLLKQLIEVASKHQGSPEKVPHHHDLARLWKLCRHHVDKAIADEIEEWPVAEAEHLIAQLSDVDPQSFAFRYPVDKEGASYLPEKLIRFSLRHFAEQLDRLGRMLGDLVEGLSVELEEANDWREDRRDEY